ncbi:hypothetical protein IKG07_00810 [Candidatus Saccharibacteria bacterium]|nr:hypothetical protein [Candidatus Saccharibacteria bacterium]
MGNATPFIIAVLIVGVMILIAMFLTKKRAYRFNKEKYQARFLSIENHLVKTNSATFMKTVIDGDKLLDKAMNEMGIPGKNMGDRLKHSKDKFSDINAVWKAHKLRNALAHEDDLEITYRQAQVALMIYKQALKDIGAI